MSQKQGSYQSLDKYLDQKIQTTEQSLQENLEQSVQKGLNMEQQAETTEIENIVQRNADLLFRGVKAVPMDEINRNASNEELDRLAELERRKPDASIKERRRIRKEREGIIQNVGNRMVARVDQAIDQRIDQAMRKETRQSAADDTEGQAREDDHFYSMWNPKLFGDTVKRIQVSASGDYRTSKEKRQEIIDHMDKVDGTLEVFQKKYGRARYASAVLQRGLAQKGQGRKYIQARMKKLESQRKSTEKTLRMYQDDIKGGLTDDTSMARFQERVNSLRDSCHLTQKQAEKEILKRGVEPATIQAVPTLVDQFKRDPAYNLNLDAIVRKLNAKLDALKARDEAAGTVEGEEKYKHLTVKEAEEYIEKYMAEILSQGEYRFRCSPMAFDAIANEKMKTQMETNTSGGLNNQGMRKAFTQRKFGCSSDEGPAETRLSTTEFENYGYVASTNAAREVDSFVSGYGMVSVQLSKEAMKDRVSCVFGDSLDNRKHTQPSLASQPSAASCNRAVQEALLNLACDRYKLENPKSSADPQLAVLRAIDYIKNRAKIFDKNDVSTRLPGYFELQFHGDVTARDMESVSIVITRLYVPDSTAPKGRRQETDEELDARKASAVLEVVAKVNEINEHPEKYGREGLPPLKCDIIDMREKEG